jgi:hypothetical protein
MKGREIAISVGLAVALTVGWLAVLPHVPNTGGDTIDYLRMAANPKAPGHTPFAFRGLAPWLAHELGGPDHYRVAFRASTATALASSGPAVYLICRRLGGGHWAALVGMAGLMSLPLWLFNLYQPYLIDGPAMALTAWAMAALVYGWLAVLPLILVACGLARETVAALALPMYMWLRTRWVDLPTACRVALLVAPAVLATWAVRQPMRTSGWPTMWSLIEAGAKISWTHRWTNDPHYWLLYAFAGSLGIWWVLAWYGRRHGGRLWWLLVPVFGQFIIGGDWSRFALYAFPVVVPAGAIALWRHPRRRLLLVLVAAQGLAVLADLAVLGRLGINSLHPSTYVAVPLIVLTAVTLWWPRRRAEAAPERDVPVEIPPQRTESTVGSAAAGRPE